LSRILSGQLRGDNCDDDDVPVADKIVQQTREKNTSRLQFRQVA
jgi:hypothetical protein